VGWFGIAYFAAHPGPGADMVRDNPERVFIALAQALFNPWIAGVLLSAILAAIMSTLSCQLLVCSSALTEDFYRGFLHPRASQRELVWFGRAMVQAVALLAIWIARDPDSRVLGLVSYAWAGFGAAFGPVVLISLSWKRMTRNGALAGMLVGAITVIAWKHAGNALYEIVPGFIAGSLAIVVASLLDRAPPAAVQATHDAVRTELHEHGY
jgi:sodium/proline symporter